VSNAVNMRTRILGGRHHLHNLFAIETINMTVRINRDQHIAAVRVNLSIIVAAEEDEEQGGFVQVVDLGSIIKVCIGC